MLAHEPPSFPSRLANARTETGKSDVASREYEQLGQRYQTQRSQQPMVTVGSAARTLCVAAERS